MTAPLPPPRSPRDASPACAGRCVALADGAFAALLALDPASGSDASWHRGWAALGRRALVENPFYEADFALPAAIAFGEGVRLLAVTDRPASEEGARFLAAWPFRVLRRRWGLPLPVLMGWTHGFCAFGAPLIDPDEPGRALAGLLAAPRALGLPPRLLMPNLPEEGVLADLLRAHLSGAGTRSASFWRHERALLALDGLSREERRGYLGHMPGERRRKLRQRLARFEAGGTIAFETLRAPDALAEGLADYVALEASGWKGAAGTAIAARPAEAAFMREAVARLGRDGRIRIDRLHRAGRTLAASVLLETRDTAWCLKISHDEREARHSPGVELVHRVTRDILAAQGPSFVDSCAAPDYRLGEMFWSGRRAIAHRLVEADGGDALFPLATGLERAREHVARYRAARRKA